MEMHINDAKLADVEIDYAKFETWNHPILQNWGQSRTMS